MKSLYQNSEVLDDMEYTRVVLFGAGASFGSRGVLPVAPPLGAGLYGVLARAFPDSWGALSRELRLKFERHFEVGMGALWGMYPDALSSLKAGAPSPHRLMQDMARLFICYHLAPGAQDVYTKFLIALWQASKGEGTCLSTLNYEYLAEQAMGKLGLRPQILRPHGGCLFWIKGGGRLFGSGRAVGQGAHCISRRIRILPAKAIYDLLNVPEQSQYPCMAIYIEDKVTQMGQQYLWRVQNRLAQRVCAAEKVVLVGVRPWASDRHIWQPIIKTSALVLYVGGDDAWEDLRRLRGSNGESVLVGNRFEECIADLVERM